ncbi:phage tail protein [Sphingomonas pruni]|uniref:phage tail protein n=1 Tax=Sphingomonas pruni TaxID=40683 RepID=UPI00082D9916|nr:tail fiber protein [Sphingomonas pruni]
MSDPFVAEIRMFAGNFAPRNWALCDGQIMAISQNTALFSLIGTFYGGNGTSTYALPDLRGRAAMHQGNGAGLSPRVIGEVAGENSVTLLSQEMPMHSHAISGAVIANSTPVGTPASNTLFTNSSPNQLYGTVVGNPVNLAPQSITIVGGSQPHNNTQPYLAVTFIICLFGVFPSRN